MAVIAGTLFDNGGQVVNVRHPDFGAVGDGRANDGPAIQRAVNAAPGRTVFFPAGQYRILAPIVVGAGTSLRGTGVASELFPQGCGCFTWPVNDGIAPALVADLFIRGNGCEHFVALHAAGTRDLAARVTGLRVERVYVAFYGTAVQWRGVWHSHIRGCTFNNVYRGVSLTGRCVKIVVDGCAMTRGTGAVVGAGPSQGVVCDSAFDYGPSGSAEARPEDVQLVRNLAFGFDVGVDWQRVLFGACEANDLDYCGTVGIRAQQSDGGLRLVGNWITLGTGAGARGIQLLPLGFASTGHTLIQGNTVGHNAPAPPPDSRAIDVGANQQNVLIQANQTRGFAGADCHVEGARRVRVVDNDFRSAAAASVRVVSSRQVAVERNAVAAPVLVRPAGAGGVSVGEQYGPD